VAFAIEYKAHEFCQWRFAIAMTILGLVQSGPAGQGERCGNQNAEKLQSRTGYQIERQQIWCEYFHWAARCQGQHRQEGYACHREYPGNWNIRYSSLQEAR